MSWQSWIAKVFHYRPPDPELNNLTSGKSQEEKLADPGVFEYDEEGFTIHYDEIVYSKKWKEIDSMHMYKTDMIAIDRIHLQIVSGERAFTINEDIPGWHQFLNHAKAALPTMMDDWWGKVVHPPFTTNRTTVYERSWGNVTSAE